MFTKQNQKEKLFFLIITSYKDFFSLYDVIIKKKVFLFDVWYDVKNVDKKEIKKKNYNFKNSVRNYIHCFCCLFFKLDIIKKVRKRFKLNGIY